jgi:hypothetical protein
MKRVSIRAIVLSVLFTLGAAYTSNSMACNWTDGRIYLASSEPVSGPEGVRESVCEDRPHCISAG